MTMRFEAQGPPLLDNASQAILAQTQIHYACYTGDGHMLDTLIGRTLLQNNNDGDAMEACVGALLSEEDAVNSWTPAHWAAFYGQLSCLMKLHIRPHLGFDTPSHRSNISPLHLAAKSGAVLCLKWLLQCGASKNRQDFMGETPLHKAAKSGNSDCAAMLVGHGVSISMKNYRGLTSADVAEQSNHLALAQYLRRALEQSEYGTVTACGDSESLPASDLGGFPPLKGFEKPQLSSSHLSSVTDISAHQPFARGGTAVGDNAQSFIFMNGEGIYNSSCAEEDSQMDADNDLEMEEEVAQSVHGYVNRNSELRSLGVKRSFGECSEFEHLKKRRCTVPSFQKDSSERYGTAHNNSVLSSYNAVLAVGLEPMSQPICDKGHPSSNAPNTPGDPAAQSSLMEHCATLVAERGYDSTMMSAMSSAFH